MRLIGLLCVMGAAISLMAGLISGHFAPYRNHRRRRRDDSLTALLREESPGFIPATIIAASLLAIGLVILVI